LLGEMEDMFRIQAVHKQLDLLFERDHKVPRFIRTDSIKLRQVLINLLNNAFKFTERGAVTLRVGVRGNDGASPNEGSHSPRLVFEVEDTGCGINSYELTRIFDAFEQAEAGRAAKEGTGLGLTISRNFVQLMGGHLSVESEEGKGSLFRFDIGINPGRTVVSETMAPSRRVAPLKPGQLRDRIPVVDDDWAKMKSTLPVEIQEGLKDAALRADMEAIDRLIGEMGEHAPRLAMKLREWAHDFEYEKILSLMEESQEG